MATLYIGFNQSSGASNPLRDVIKMIAETSNAAGSAVAKVVDRLVDENEVEADVAAVSTTDEALKALKETERTVIILAFMADHVYMAGNTSGRTEALAFAARFPERVFAGPIVEPDGEENYIFLLKRKVAEVTKSKEST